MKHGILAAILLPLTFTACDDSTQHAAPAPKAESSASGQTSPAPQAESSLEAELNKLQQDYEDFDESGLRQLESELRQLESEIDSW